MYPPRFQPRSSSHAPKVRSNEQIRAPQIRLIGAKGEQIGIVPTKEGIRRAEEAALDLVEVAPLAKPPVCRILDLGKYLYSLEKKEKEARKKQKVIAVKEVKMTSKIEEHDYQTKLRNSRIFIERGDKVKLSMMFRGREITHADLGKKIMDRFVEDISDIAEVERNVGLEGNTFHIYFMPRLNAKKPSSKEPKAEKGAALQMPPAKVPSDKPAPAGQPDGQAGPEETAAGS